MLNIILAISKKKIWKKIEKYYYPHFLLPRFKIIEQKFILHANDECYRSGQSKNL